MENDFVSKSKLEADLITLRSKVEAYEAALKHYADEGNWYCATVHIHSIDDPGCISDTINNGPGVHGYSIAAAALAQIDT